MDPTTFCNCAAAHLETRRDVVDGLRALADLLEQHPLWALDWKPDTFAVWNYDHAGPLLPDGEHLLVSSRVLRSGRPVGAVKKFANDWQLGIEVELSPAIVLRAAALRDNVCHLVETGETERVAIVEVPDDVAAAYTRYEDRPVMERVCPDVLGSGRPAGVA